MNKNLILEYVKENKFCPAQKVKYFLYCKCLYLATLRYKFLGSGQKFGKLTFNKN